jgi:NHL repeat
MRRLALLPLLAALAVATGPVAASPARAEPSAGELTVFAGTGEQGSSGDGGPATRAQLHSPSGIAVAADGTVYVGDLWNHTVRAVAPDGIIRTVAGTGNVPPTAAVQDGVPANRFDLASPADLAVGPDGSLYIADVGLFRVFRLAPDGRITLLAGNGVQGYDGDGGPATAAQIGRVLGLAVGGDGTVYLGAPDSHRVRAVRPDGTITTVAGNGGARLEAAGGPATGIPVPAAMSLSPDSAGNLWVADGGCLHQLSSGRIVTVTEPGEPGGQRWGISSAASWPPPEGPLGNVAGVAAAGGTVYVLTTLGELRRLGAGQRLETVADVRGHGFQPIAAAAGAVYLVDHSGNRVYVTHPAPPAPAPSGPRSSLPWWPFALAGAAILVLVAIVVGVRRGRRSAP